MICHADALFPKNADGDMTQTAPAVYWGIARESTLVLYRHDVPAEIRRKVNAIVQSVQNAWADYATALHQLSAHFATQDVWIGPVFAFPDALPRFEEPVRVLPRDGHLLAAEFPEQARTIDRIQPCLAVVRDGRVVSACYTARSGHCVDAGVDTVDGFKRMGLGAAVCAEWAQAVRDLGQVPIYSTSWENIASRRLAERLNLQWIGIDVHFEVQMAWR